MQRLLLGLLVVVLQSALLGCSNDRPPISNDDCTSTTNVPCTAPPAIAGSGGLSSCGLTSSVVACNDCIEQDCCQVDTACAKNPSCLDLSTCLNDCIPDGGTTVDPTCAQFCQAEQDAGISDYLNLTNCIQSACPICQ
jgi:hypothetical protein